MGKLLRAKNKRKRIQKKQSPLPDCVPYCLHYQGSEDVYIQGKDTLDQRTFKRQRWGQECDTVTILWLWWFCFFLTAVLRVWAIILRFFLCEHLQTEVGDVKIVEKIEFLEKEYMSLNLFTNFRMHLFKLPC